MQPSPPPIAGTFHLAKLKLRALKNNSPHPPSPSLASAVLLSASGNLTTADTSRKWDHTALPFGGGLTSLRTASSRFLHGVACVRMPLLLRRSDMSL